MSNIYENIEKVEKDMLEVILSKYNANDVDLNDTGSNIRADRVLYVLDKINEEIKEMADQRIQAVEFYNTEIEKKEKIGDHLRFNLKSFIEAKGEKTIKLPNGTLRMRTTKKFIYPEDNSSIIKFCEDRKIELSVLIKPDLKKLKKYITETGDSPEELKIEEHDSFSYKTAKEG